MNNPTPRSYQAPPFYGSKWVVSSPTSFLFRGVVETFGPWIFGGAGEKIGIQILKW